VDEKDDAESGRVQGHVSVEDLLQRMFYRACTVEDMPKGE
jgi:hypothetical protein